MQIKKLPLFIQNIIFSLYNMFVLYKKYGYFPVFNSMDRIVKKLENEGDPLNDEPDDLKRINELINYAKRKTDFYKRDEYFTLESVDDLKKIPVLNKKTIRSQTEKFYSKDINFLNSVKFRTSGTSGQPLGGFIKISDLQLRYDALLKYCLQRGSNIQNHYARFVWLDIGDSKNIYRKDFINGHLFLSEFHMSDDTIHKYHDALTKHKIETVEGYPSLLFTLASLLSKHGLEVPSLKQCFCTAEKLLPKQRQLIEEVFECPVYDYYGSSEQSVLAVECSNNKMHVISKTGYLEVLDEKGDNVCPGKEGRMVVTSFTSHFMPLIRYEIGDWCKLSKDQSCECGGKGLILDEIIGRQEDIFIAEDGRHLTRISLRLVPDDVVASQLLLRMKSKTALLSYISERLIPEEEFDRFKKQLLGQLGVGYVLKINKVDELKKTARGKTRAVEVEED